MVEYFVTKGKLVVRNNEPLVEAEGETKALTKAEFILWTSLHWNILNKDSLEAEFSRRMKKYRLFGDVSFEQTLKRLKTRGLVASKSDYLAVDALYNLVKDLYVVPFGTFNVFKKTMMFGVMLIDGTPLDKCREAMADFDLKGLEKQIVCFSKRLKVSGAELIRISDKGLWDIKSEDDIVPLAYDEHEDTDILGNYTRFSKDKTKVLEAIVNLYLKKQIVFE
ncbi:MAG: hypothetical protein E7403_06870 [Ruminococcaceae bacterium]|nr:hypothetical protein [Oscillospiraceae bacterium]